ncbi:MAG: sugar ABC transporter ATP-binding protein [Ilumatobacteraceae bacterium]
MRGIVKRFPGVVALGGVDLDVRAGEVHCLVGQNGAGKSTLIKVLSGSYQPTEGEVIWDGEFVVLDKPTAAIGLGISTIYQELDLVDHLTVTESVFLGHELASAGFLRREEATRRTSELLARLGHPEISPNTTVAKLSPAGQQVVSMARALSHDTRLLILDEPSAVLDREEVSNLFRVIRGLAAAGVAIVYISHRLDEIRAIGDRVTVLKDGNSVGVGLPVAETSTADLIKLMTGRDIKYVFPKRSAEPPSDNPVLEVRDLAFANRFRGVNFTVHAGEILGLAGLVGAGRSEILETIFGVRRSSSGTVTVDGVAVRSHSTSASVQAGMGLCPEERKTQGLLIDQAVYRNVTLSSLSRFSRFSFLNRKAEHERSAEVCKSLDVRPAGVDRLVNTLSGGNQQKVVLARWLLRDCRVLLLDEPTRGVDVGARTEIYAVIRQLADSGVAVVVVSSEVEEVIGLADRVLVIRDGAVVHESRAQDIDERRVLDLVMKGT